MKLQKNFTMIYRPNLMGIIVVGDVVIEKVLVNLNKSNRISPDSLLPKYNDSIF